MSILVVHQHILKELSSIYDEDESKAIAKELIEYYTNVPLQKNIEQGHSLTSAISESIETALGRLLQKEPLQYVLAEAWFYGLPFYVNKHVLIPRPETEELVELILNDSTSNFQLPTSNFQPPISILDIGTGSGCIPIVLKKKLPNATVYGIDISDEALAVAKQNAKRNNVEVHFLQHDILNSQLSIPNSQFSLIVSNPPYITDMEKLVMHANVLEHEPHLALFVTNNNPLQFYEAIVLFSLKHLQAGGKLYFEINKLYGKNVVELLTVNGFNDVQLLKDMNGNDRMVFGAK